MPARPVPSIAFLCAALAAASAAPLAAQAPPPGFTVETLFDGGLARASCMTFLPDGRLLLGERNTGKIRVFAAGQLLPDAWATLPTLTSPGTEQGLLGIAADPGFLQNRFVYVYASSPDGVENRIFRLKDANGTGIDATLLTAPGQIPGFGIHNGGRMCFGLDGRLYVGTGDAGRPLLAQDPASQAGKMLRFTVPDLGVPP